MAVMEWILPSLFTRLNHTWLTYTIVQSLSVLSRPMATTLNQAAQSLYSILLKPLLCIQPENDQIAPARDTFSHNWQLSGGSCKKENHNTSFVYTWICDLLICEIRKWRRNFGVIRVIVTLKMK